MRFEADKPLALCKIFLHVARNANLEKVLSCQTGRASMITTETDFLKQLVNPILLADENGTHSHHERARGFDVALCRAVVLLAPSPKSTPLFGKPEFPKCLRAARSIRIGKVSRRVTVIPVGFDGKENGHLYLFDTADILKIMDFDTFLDHIDVGIAITDQDGVLEHLNETLSKYIGVDVKEWIGRNLHELVEERALTESASLNALKAKKPMNTNVTYGSGITLQYLSIPIF